jgi:hypothetical protein
VGILECTRIVPCARAIRDAATGLATFVDVYEVLRLPKAALGQCVPVVVHFSIVGEGDFEVRPVWVDARGETSPAGDLVDRVSVRGRSAFLAPQVRVPDRAGAYALALEWRYASPVGGRWRLASARAPVDVQVAEVDASAARSTEAPS